MIDKIRKESLKCYEIDTINLHFLHWYDETVFVCEGLDILKNSGKKGDIRYHSHSIWNQERLIEAQRAAEEYGFLVLSAIS